MNSPIMLSHHTIDSHRANPQITGFFLGQQPDGEGRFLDELQDWPDQLPETIHDFIPSSVNPGAPVLDEETIAYFHARPELRQALRTSWLRMLDFYGLLSGGQLTSSPA